MKYNKILTLALMLFTSIAFGQKHAHADGVVHDHANPDGELVETPLPQIDTTGAISATVGDYEKYAIVKAWKAIEQANAALAENSKILEELFGIKAKASGVDYEFDPRINRDLSKIWFIPKQKETKGN